MSRTFKMLAVVALLGSSAAWAAPSKQTVNYVCQGKVRATVSYSFNAETGLPTSARVKIKGKSFTVQYDESRSDHVDSHFQNSQGYKLSAPALTMKGLRSTGGIIIFDKNDNMLGKDCNPK